MNKKIRYIISVEKSYICGWGLV